MNFKTGFSERSRRSQWWTDKSNRREFRVENKQTNKQTNKQNKNSKNEI
jgi:hypothetical protein